MWLFNAVHPVGQKIVFSLTLGLCLISTGCNKTITPPDEQSLDQKQAVTSQPSSTKITSTASEPVIVKPPVVLAVHGQIYPLSFNIPECKGQQCVQININGLHSDHANLDDAVNRYVANYVQNVVQGLSDSSQKSASTTALINVKTLNQSTMQQGLQESIDKIVALSNEAKSLGSPAQLSLEIVPQMLETKAPIATVSINANNYMGGAHGSSAQQFINFDIQKNRIINLDNLLQEGQRKAFNDLAYQVFIDWVKETDPSANLKTYQEMWPFTVTENFYLSSQGLALQYGEYEIGPYAVGLPRLILPYDKLTRILKSEYLPKNLK